MFKSIWEDVKREYNYGNMVTRIIIANIAVFVFFKLIWIALRIGNAWQDTPLYDSIMHFFMISSDWKHNLTHPWVLITTMFLHEGFLHILFNMLFMYWFGRIVGDFIGNRRILPLYLLGGIMGNILYFASINLLPYGGDGVHYALGASAAVVAITVAAGVIAPDYSMRLLFIGDIKLKYIVAFLVFMYLLGMAGNINTGGHFAHIGGAIMGGIFIWQLRQGNDLSIPVNNLLTSIQEFFRSITGNKSRNGPRVVYRNTAKTRKSRNSRGDATTDEEDLSHQEQLDAILDKIKKSGYESLSSEEKEFLFNASKK